MSKRWMLFLYAFRLFSVLDNCNNIYILVHSFHEVLFICLLPLLLTTNNAIILSRMNGSLTNLTPVDNIQKKALKGTVTGETTTSGANHSQSAPQMAGSCSQRPEDLLAMLPQFVYDAPGHSYYCFQVSPCTIHSSHQHEHPGQKLHLYWFQGVAQLTGSQSFKTPVVRALIKRQVHKHLLYCWTERMLKTIVSLYHFCTNWAQPQWTIDWPSGTFSPQLAIVYQITY